MLWGEEIGLGRTRAGGQTRCTNAHAVVRRTERRLLPLAERRPRRAASAGQRRRLRAAQRRLSATTRPLLNWMERMIRLRKSATRSAGAPRHGSTPAKDASSRIASTGKAEHCSSLTTSMLTTRRSTSQTGYPTSHSSPISTPAKMSSRQTGRSASSSTRSAPHLQACDRSAGCASTSGDQ